MNQSGLTPRVTAEICALLNAHGIAFRQVRHLPTRTSEESAQARGEDLQTGGKALVVKVDDKFLLFVLSAARKLDSKALKSRFNAKKTRFASQEELLELTGLEPGSIPPFGNPILPFGLYVDQSIASNETIAFNAGSLTDSIVMQVSDYLTLTAAEVFSFSIE